MTDTDNKLKEHVQYIAHNLSNGIIDPDWNVEEHDGEEPSAFDYLQDALDIEYIVASNGKDYLGARVCVAFGGPNIWIDTRRQVVEGFWWGDYARASYDDEIELDEALSELWSCK